MKTIRVQVSSFALAIAGLVAATSPTFAQTAEGAAVEAAPSEAPAGAINQTPAVEISSEVAADATDDAAEIVITGTRLRNGANAPTPVSIITSEQLLQASPGLVSEALNQLPAFKSSSRSTTSTQSQARDGGASFLNLRGIGKERTLVLLDGRRFVSSSSAGIPDINLFPQNLIQRVDVVTGGASAAYGSDAVSGVVNFVLDTKFTGVKLDANAGVSTRSDGETVNLALAAGQSFAGGKGHVIGSVSYFDQARIGFGTGRENVDAFYGVAAIGGGVRSVVADQRFAIPTGGRIQGLAAGSPLSPGVVNLQFREGGLVAPYSFGTLFDGVRQVGGDGSALPYDVSAGTERYVGFLRSQYELSDSVTAFAEATFAQTRTQAGFQWPQVGILGYQFTIYSDNAFLRQLPAATQATLGLPAAGGASVPLFTLRRIPEDNGLVRTDLRNRTWRGMAGVEWDLGSDFELVAYYMHGQSKYRNQVENNPLQTRRYAAVDAVVDPATGRVVCRSTLVGAFAGCVPMNPFGPDPGNDAAYDWINGTSQLDLTLKQDVASAIVRGSPFDLPAGPVNMAAGVEYRREDSSQRADADTLVTLTAADVASIRAFPAALLGVPGGNFHYSAGLPLNGSYNVKEAFIEGQADLFKDEPVANLMSINGAVRLIDYSTAGTVTTWKAGAIYEPVEGVRLRATRSRDIRAANIQELFTGFIQATGTVNFQGSVQPLLGIRSGNVNLDPEKADTLTYGLVLRPSFLPGFDFSVDRYDIKINGAIQQLTNQQTVDACAAGSALACSQISRSPAGMLVIQTPTLNLAEIRNKGIDFEMGYSRPLWDGMIGLRGFASYLEEFSNIVPGAPVIDRAGDIGLSGTPHWSGTLQLTYARGGFAGFVQQRYIGPGKVDSTLTDAQLIGNAVPHVWYTDVTLRHDVKALGDAEVYITANNLFDREPPVAPATPFGSYRSSNPGLYDFIGRYITVGARLKF